MGLVATAIASMPIVAAHNLSQGEAAAPDVRPL
jgi:hypothetical protein